MDWNISSKDQAFGRFSYSNMHQFSPSPLGPMLDGYYGDGNFRQYWRRTWRPAKPTSLIRT